MPGITTLHEARDALLVLSFVYKTTAGAYFFEN